MARSVWQGERAIAQTSACGDVPQFQDENSYRSLKRCLLTIKIGSKE